MAQQKENNTIVTIDPGSNGSIVIFDQGTITSVNMPKTVKDLYSYFSDIETKYSNIFIFIEKVQSFGSDSKEGGKSFGIIKMLKNYFQLLAVIEIKGFRFVEVPPITWQTTLGLKIKKPKEIKQHVFKTMRKNLYKDYAIKHFPGTKVTLANSDALCLIQFAFVKMRDDVEWIRTRVQGGEPDQLKINLK